MHLICIIFVTIKTMGLSVFKQHKKLLFSLAFFAVFGLTLQIFAAPPVTTYSQGETLDPSCVPGSTNCIVSIIPDQTGNSGKYLTTNGTTASWSTISGGGGGLSSVSVTGSLSGDGTLLNPLSINQATSGSDGYLSSTDWSVFNNKLSSISTSGVVSGDGTMGNPLTLSLATNSSDGYLSSVDWGTFDSKLSSVSVFGVLSGDGTIGNPLTVNQSNSSTDGYLSATDWATFNNKQDFLTGSGVISVSFGSVGINQATSGSDGYLSSTDWSTFNGKQDLISVTTGGVVFGGSFGELIADASLLFFDQNNSRLGVGTNSPSGLFSVGSSSQFMVDTNGDLTAVKGVTYSWPSSQAGGNGYVLSNDGSGVLSWSAPGAASMAVGSAVTSSTPGSILFADALSQLGEDNSNLFWDATNKNLGLMTASPQASLHIAGSPFLSSFQLAIERGAVAGTYGGANTGNARFLFGVDALNNPGIEIMRGETGFSQANSALYWDWSWSDGVDNDFRFYIEDANIFHIAGNTGTGSKLLKLDDMGLTVGQGVIFAGLNSTVGSGDALCIDPISNVVSRDSSGACAVSSQRFKHDIISLQLNALDTVNALRSVTFKYNGTDKIRTGFIAEEVEQVNKDYVVYEADGVTPHGVYYLDMIPLLVKSIQELDLKITPITSLDIANPNSLGALIKQFLANTQNTILDLYAQIIHADRVETKQLCIGQTCVDENQLKQLLQQGGGSSGGTPIVNPNPPVVDDIPPPTDEIVVPSGDTEQVVEEVVPLAENPEPVAPIETIPQNDTPTPTE